MTIDGARFGHVNVTSHDWRRLAAFYTDVFGCVFVPPERDIRSADLDAATGLHDAHLTGRPPAAAGTRRHRADARDLLVRRPRGRIPARGSTVQAGAISPSRCRMSRPPSTRSWQPVEAGTATSSPPGRPTAARSPGSTPPTRTAISSNCRRGRPPRPGNDAARRAPDADDPRRRARDRARARGHDLSDRLWSARLLLDDPVAIEDVHLAYFRAGARVATTASYQATIPGFAAAGLDRAAALAAIRRSVERRAPGARAVRARGHRAGAPTSSSSRVLSVRTARCSPTAPSTAATTTPGEADAARRPRVRGSRRCSRPAPTCSRSRRSRRDARGARAGRSRSPSSGATAWLSYQCRDGATTAAGEPIDGRRRAGIDARVVAVGVNCTAPRHVPALLTAAAAGTPKPLIAYPNDGDTWDAHDRRWVAADLGGRFDATAVASWTGLGAAWLGGCCGTSPTDIAALAAAIGES